MFQSRYRVVPELIQQYAHLLTDESGITYRAFAYGQSRADGTWEGWIEFHPVKGTHPVLRTGRETTQPDRSALAYWASGLEPVYFEGAFDRAIRSSQEQGRPVIS
ncbi:MAG TPA: hypothetical protein VNO14_03075 [Blastocatellia bacterium]|nr:hypothetical protein [Blastocatellia bacterium]